MAAAKTKKKAGRPTAFTEEVMRKIEEVAALGGSVRDWLKDAILEKHEGFYQLAYPKYKINSNAKRQLESKEDMKKRGCGRRTWRMRWHLRCRSRQKGIILGPCG